MRETLVIKGGKFCDTRAVQSREKANQEEEQRKEKGIFENISEIGIEEMMGDI